jgi:transposase-like protein
MVENAPHPIGGIDYPRTLKEFDEWFASEAACAEFVRRVRWPDGFRCPSCAETEAWTTGRGQFRCSRCQRQISPTAGTIFEGTRKPLRLWFQAMWYVTNQKHGVSALGVQRILGLGSYQTAWTWLHKLRRAMVRPGRDLLDGESGDR